MPPVSFVAAGFPRASCGKPPWLLTAAREARAQGTALCLPLPQHVSEQADATWFPLCFASLTPHARCSAHTSPPPLDLRQLFPMLPSAQALPSPHVTHTAAGLSAAQSPSGAPQCSSWPQGPCPAAPGHQPPRQTPFAPLLL